MEFITAPRPEKIKRRTLNALKLREAILVASDLDFSEEKIDSIISRLTDRQVIRGNMAHLKQEEVAFLAHYTTSLLMKDPVCLDIKLNRPIYIVGDLYGQHGKLVQIFEALGHPSKQRYLFLGNYVNRGSRSLELVSLLFAYKLRYPENVLLLRGNHECHYISYYYGFSHECRKRFTQTLWKTIMNAFNCLPVAAIIEDAILCVHSGLIKDNPLLSLRSQAKFREFLTEAIERPTTISSNPYLEQLVWSEPVYDSRGWYINPAGKGYFFGEPEVIDFCEHCGFQQVIRSNELIRNGYEFAAGGKLLTICSVPFLARGIRNAGAVVSLTGQLCEKTIIGRIVLLQQEFLLRTGRPNIAQLIFRDSLGGPVVEHDEKHMKDEEEDENEEEEVEESDRPEEVTVGSKGVNAADELSTHTITLGIDYADLNSQDTFEYFQSSVKSFPLTPIKRFTIRASNDFVHR
ncbi:unnamed protein product [Echinostoma caproni]|uniref:Serine/threonine-protein phosphatase n=1 Tax=Echinostoma caproni TaxID=27848 RepID=A0A183AY93_9TREM|nr:unnamed protein product [Echinostoma caproni]